MDTHGGTAGDGGGLVDLREIIRRVVAGTEVTDLAALAGMVADRIPRRAYAEVLAVALVPMVRETVGLDRVRAHAAARVQAPSAKVASIRAWQTRLRENIWVGGEERPRKLLGDCTVADLGKAVDRRRAMAAHNLLVAEELELLQQALAADRGARVVRDLPPNVLADLLGQGAVVPV